jgi:hypothetical protein
MTRYRALDCFVTSFLAMMLSKLWGRHCER